MCTGESPVTNSGLSGGQHRFQVSPQGCIDGTSYRLSAKFTVPWWDTCRA